MDLLLLWIIFGLFAANVATDRGADGFLWLVPGLLFGPLALAAALFHGQQCSQCRKWISPEAKICAHCRSAIEQRADWNLDETQIRTIMKAIDREQKRQN